MRDETVVLGGPEVTDEAAASAPLLRALSRRPVPTLGASALCGAGMVLSEQIAAPLPAVVFLLWVILASSLFILAQARLRPLPPEPPAQVHEIAYNCVICGRPLTNPQSMRARVGSTCIQRYGPRYKMIANPDHARWRGLLAAAEAERAAEQARLNLEHQHAMARYRTLARAWDLEVASPAGQERRRNRGTGRRLTLLGAGSVPALFIGAAVALPQV